MFKRMVCYVSKTDDGHGYIFSIRRGDEVITDGVTYDGLDGMKTIVKSLSGHRVRKFIMLD